MTVRIDSLSTDVVAENPAPQGGTQDPKQAMQWQEQAKAAAMHARLARDRARTASAGFDD